MTPIPDEEIALLTETPRLLERVQSLGHTIFTEGSYNLNIVGVRSSERTAGAFDDWICFAWRDIVGYWTVRSFRATTDPGTHYLEHPMRAKGCAVLAAGQYRGCWQIGKHKGYDALVQRKPLLLHRDANRDHVIDTDAPATWEAATGINLHCASSSPFDPGRTHGPAKVNRWSAGCQVIQHPRDYRAAWDIITASASYYGPTFTYTLIDEADLR